MTCGSFKSHPSSVRVEDDGVDGHIHVTSWVYLSFPLEESFIKTNVEERGQRGGKGNDGL